MFCGIEANRSHGAVFKLGKSPETLARSHECNPHSVIQSINIKPAHCFILEQKNNLDVADVVTHKISFIAHEVE
jgi:hypothetical protein